MKPPELLGLKKKFDKFVEEELSELDVETTVVESVARSIKFSIILKNNDIDGN